MSRFNDDEMHKEAFRLGLRRTTEETIEATPSGNKRKKISSFTRELKNVHQYEGPTAFTATCANSSGTPAPTDPFKRGLRQSAEEWQAKRAARRTNGHLSDAHDIQHYNWINGAGAEEEEVEDPLPVLAQREPKSLPGAHPQAGINSSPISISEHGNGMHNGSEEDPGPAVVNFTANNEGLVEANPVGSSRFISTNDLDVAEPMDPFTTDEQVQRMIQERKKTKSMVLYMLAGGFALLLIVTFIIYFVTNHSSSNSKEEVNGASRVSATAPMAAPTQGPLWALLPASTQQIIQEMPMAPHSWPTNGS